MREFRRKLVALCSMVAILMAVMVLPGCDGGEEPAPVPPPNEPNATATP